MPRYGIVNGLNLFVVIASGEYAAARRFLDGYPNYDNKPRLAPLPRWDCYSADGLTKLEKPRTKDEYALMVEQVFDILPGHYHGDELIRGDGDIAAGYRSALWGDHDGARRFVAFRLCPIDAKTREYGIIDANDMPFGIREVGPGYRGRDWIKTHVINRLASIIAYAKADGGPDCAYCGLTELQCLKNGRWTGCPEWREDA